MWVVGGMMAVIHRTPQRGGGRLKVDRLIVAFIGLWLTRAPVISSFRGDGGCIQ